MTKNDLVGKVADAGITREQASNVLNAAVDAAVNAIKTICAPISTNPQVTELTSYSASREIFLHALGQKLKARMTELRLTRRMLSNMTGISESSISKYLAGEKEAGIVKIHLLKHALNVEPSFFLDINAVESNPGLSSKNRDEHALTGV